MHTYYSGKPNDRRKKQLPHGYRYTRRKPIDPWQPPATPIRTKGPPPSERSYAAGYAPVYTREPTTAPPLRRKVMNTDPELPVAARQSHVPPRAYQADTQKLPSVKNDDDSLTEHLKRLAAEIQWLFKKLRSQPHFGLIVILVCLAIILQAWLQVVASWINFIYIITGILASIIVIVEFMKRNR